MSHFFTVDGRYYDKFNFEDLNICIRSVGEIITLEKVFFHLQNIRKPISLFGFDFRFGKANRFNYFCFLTDTKVASHMRVSYQLHRHFANS